MKVLVTGSTGGLGNLIVNKLLQQGIEVVATSKNLEKAIASDFYNKVKYIPFDINSPTKTDLFSYFEKPDSIIHLAWEKLDYYNSSLHLSTILNSHKLFLLNLISNGLKDINVVGTCYEYGLIEGLLKEDLDVDPQLPYPKAKNELRKYIEEQKSLYNFSFKWIRVFYVFGEIKGRKNLYSHLLTAIGKKEEFFNMSGGEQIRDFLTPQEIVNLIVKVSLQKKVQSIINCCSGNPVKLKDFVTDFLQKNNCQIRLNLGFYPYLNHEPMISWGSIEKLNTIP